MPDNKKDEIYNMLNDFQSILKIFICPDYPEKNIYSSQYYREVLSKLYSDSRKEFALIYGDFDGLNDINIKKGFDVGTKSLDIALGRISSILPERAVISRVGGDEFIILIPNATKIDAKRYQKHINTALAKNPSEISGLTITTALADYRAGNIYELEKITEESVVAQKHAREDHILANFINDSSTQKKGKEVNSLSIISAFNSNFKPTNQTQIEEKNKTLDTKLQIPDFVTDENEKKNWNILNYLIECKISRHLTDFRPSKAFTYTVENNLDKEVTLIVNLLYNSLEKTKSIKMSNNIEPEKVTSKIIPTDIEKAKRLHLALTSDDNNYFETLPENELVPLLKDLKDLLVDLSTNEKSNTPNKYYLKLFLEDILKKLNSKWQITLYSMSGTRVSNTAFGHITTDKRLESTSNLFVDSMTSQLENINITPYDFNNQSNSYLIHYDAGDFLTILPSNDDTKLKKEQLDKLLYKINSNYSLEDPNSTFMMSYSSIDDVRISEKFPLSNHIEELREKPSPYKDIIKSDNLLSVTNTTAIERTLSPAIDYYIKNIPNALEDNKIKRAFMLRIFSALYPKMIKHNIHSSGIPGIPNVLQNGKTIDNIIIQEEDAANPRIKREILTKIHENNKEPER